MIYPTMVFHLAICYLNMFLELVQMYWVWVPGDNTGRDGRPTGLQFVRRSNRYMNRQGQ